MPTGSEDILRGHLKTSFKERTVRRFVKASIVFSFTYFIFIKSARSHRFHHDVTTTSDRKRGGGGGASTSPTLDEFEKVGKKVRAYYAIVGLIFALFFIQAFVMCLLDLDSFRNFRYLDCLLIGRATLDGRFSRFAKYLMVLFSAFQVTWLITMNYFRPNFTLQSMIFLLHERHQVAAYESSPIGAESAAESDIQLNRKLDHNQEQPLVEAMFFKQLDQKDRLIQVRSFNDRALFRLTNRYVSVSSGGDQAEPNYVLRPTRTAQAYDQLVGLTWYYLILMGVAIFFLVPFGLRVVLPMHITQMGFELNYANCVNYLLNHPNYFRFVNIRPAHQIMFSSIRRSILPITDIRPLNGYELARWLLDLSYALIFWVLVVLNFVSDTYLALIIAADTGNYARILRSRVALLMGELNSLRVAKLSNQTAHELEQNLIIVEQDDDEQALELLDAADYEMIGSLTTSQLGTRDDSRHTEGVSMRVVASEQKCLSSCSLISQTLIVDFFQLIELNNAYVSFYLLYTIFFWLAFSFVDILLVMTLNSRGHIGKAQIYFLQLGTTFYFITICCFYSHTRQQILDTYEKLATIMALDNSSDGTKERWCAILRYFYPVPLYCFSMFRSNEISWMFMMKLVAWIGSAFLVMLNFQRVYQVVDVPFSGD